VRFVHDDAQPRLIAFERWADEGDRLLFVLINAGDTPAALPYGRILYSRKAEGGKLLPGGAAIVEG